MERNKKILLIALSVLLVVATAVGGTFAYLRSETDDVVNTFKANGVTVTLTETTGNSYNIVPGTVQAKDPAVTVENTLDVYTYVEVTDATDGLVDYTLAAGWLPLGDAYPNVYYREVKVDDAVKTFPVLNNNQVSYPASLTNEDMLEDNNSTLRTDIKLTFQAIAIQKDPFGDPIKAYLQEAPASVTNSEELLTAIANAQEGDVIYLAPGTFAPAAGEQWKITTKGITLVGSGEGETVLNAGQFAVSGQAGLYVAADNVTIRNMTVKTESTDGNVAALKVTDYNNVATAINNFTLENVTITGNKGHGLNLHNVNGATVSNVTVTAYGKVGLSFAMAKNVVVTNTSIAAGGWADAGFMYADRAGYEEPSSVTFGAGNTFGNGTVYSERPASATADSVTFAEGCYTFNATVGENGTQVWSNIQAAN